MYGFGYEYNKEWIGGGGVDSNVNAPVNTGKNMIVNQLRNHDSTLFRT